MPKNKRFNLWVIVGLLSILLFTIYIFHKHQSEINCIDEYRQDSIILAPDGTQMAVEISADPVTQAKGLSGRQCIANDWGMLFSFKDSDIRQFWMKDMNFPIDIVWIDDNFQVVGVETNVSPDTYPQTFASPSPVKFVLETGANQAEDLGLVTGATVTF